MLAPEKPRLRNTPNAALSTRSRTDCSRRPGSARCVVLTAFLPFIRSNPLRWYQGVPYMHSVGTLEYHTPAAVVKGASPMLLVLAILTLLGALRLRRRAATAAAGQATGQEAVS